MKYSIIVPIYKVEQFLVQCIESVKFQTYINWELILVDDGSPDNCPRICDEYAQKDSRIKVVHKKNGGLVSARKAGLEVASGDYAICLDGDDFLKKDCLERIHYELSSHKVDILCHGYFINSKNGNELSKSIYRYRQGYYDRNNIETEILPVLLCSSSAVQFPPMIWSKVFRMSLYRKYQMKVLSEIRMGEDRACTYPFLANAQSMIIIQDALYYYRQVETSMTKEKKPLSWDNYDLVYEILNKEIDLTKFDLRKQYYRDRTRCLFNISMSQFLSQESHSDIVISIKKRFREHPEYLESVKNAEFNSLSMVICRFVLMNKLYGIIGVFSKYKNILKKIVRFVN